MGDFQTMWKRFFFYIIADYAICIMEESRGYQEGKVIENKLKGGINKCNACM